MLSKSEQTRPGVNHAKDWLGELLYYHRALPVSSLKVCSYNLYATLSWFLESDIWAWHKFLWKYLPPVFGGKYIVYYLVVWLYSNQSLFLKKILLLSHFFVFRYSVFHVLPWKYFCISCIWLKIHGRTSGCLAQLRLQSVLDKAIFVKGAPPHWRCHCHCQKYFRIKSQKLKQSTICN